MGAIRRIVRPDISPEGLRFVRREVWSRRWYFLGFFFLSLFAALLEVTGLGLVFPLLIIVVDPASIDRLPLLARAIDAIGLGRGTALSITLIGAIGLIMIAKNAYMLLFQRLQLRTLAYWKTDLSSRLMGVYLFSDFSVHLAKSTSEIIRNVSLTASVYDQFVAASLTVLVNGVLLAAMLTLLVFVMPPETLVSLVVIIAAAYGLYRALRRPFERIGAQENELYRQRQSVLLQAIGMIKETKLTAKEKFFLDAFANIERRSFGRQARYNFLTVIPPLVIESAIIFAILGIITYILFFSGQQNTGLAVLGVLAATLFRLTPVINRILSSLQLMNHSRNAVDLLGKEFDQLEPQVFSPEVEPDPLLFDKSITFEDVDFVYPESTAQAVKRLSFSIAKGEVIGITGASGSGKSTLAALFMGLVPPTNGRILVDDQPLESRAQVRAWQRHIGFVPQGIFLIEDTIAANVAFGVKREDINRHRIWEVIDVAQMRDVVEALPNGIDEFLGEDGARLSGGQRQRIGIARVLYQDPEVLVFDEATSALDNAIERAFSDEMMRLRRGRTLIIIAHRLTTLRDCDRIFMLANGEVIDAAPFDELEARCEPFRRLVELGRMKDLKEGGRADAVG